VDTGAAMFCANRIGEPEDGVLGGAVCRLPPATAAGRVSEFTDAT